MNTTYSRFLEGDRVYLRPLDESDADGPYSGWLNDSAACAGNSHHVFPYPKREALEYIRSAGGARRDLVLAIALKADDRHIGNISLSRIHPINRSAEFAILLGDRQEWSKGYGLEASRLLLRHGFYALNLERIECGTFATNIGMRKLAAALGMRQEGVRRQAVWKDGSFVDVLDFGVLRSEFQNAV